jgi:peptidoglycan/xylan/chitin deacetylase (PgdA/CDA1 family)
MSHTASRPRLMRSFLGITLLIALGASAPAADPGAVQYIGKTKYLNHARAVVAHTIDDSTKYVVNCIDAMDKYGIKATIFVSTEQDPAPEDRFFTQLQVRELWPRLRQAAGNGHEIGSHSRQHPCKRPDSEAWCSAAYSDYEVTGSRDDILRLTQQPYVWSWCYPCGHCANHEFIQKQLAAAGYIVARNYPDEQHDGHIRPDLQTWDSNPMNAAYTQVVQKRGGAARSEVIDVATLAAKFDQVYERGGIYNFMSHPQWLDYGADGFYERHLAHISRRRDVWYVPMGPLYAYRTIHDKTEVRPLGSGAAKARFQVSNTLDPKIYNGSLTLDFLAPQGTAVFSNGKKLTGQVGAVTDRWDQEYFSRDGEHLYVTVRSNTVLEFRSK